jgi:hypothetical protein
MFPKSFKRTASAIRPLRNTWPYGDLHAADLSQLILLGVNPWLRAHNTNIAWFSCGDGGEDLRYKRTEIVNAVARRADQYNANGVRREVLLELQVLVHSDENLELPSGLAKEGTVFQAGPTHPDYGVRVELSEIAREIDWN